MWGENLREMVRRLWDNYGTIVGRLWVNGGTIVGHLGISESGSFIEGNAQLLTIGTNIERLGYR